MDAKKWGLVLMILYSLFHFQNKHNILGILWSYKYVFFINTNTILFLVDVTAEMYSRTGMTRTAVC